MMRDRFAGTARRTLRKLLALALLAPAVAAAQDEETNKALARRFYEQVWFSRHMSAVDELFASEYVAHDIGDRKDSREKAEEQKQIAEFFWQNGTMSGSIDFQIAEGDLVATRWQWRYQPRTWLTKVTMLGARNPIPIINVFRFQDGKIVELWNHRHDIDAGYATNLSLAKGFAAGVACSVVVSLVLRIRRRRREAARRGAAGSI